MNVLRTKREGLLTGGQGLAELTRREVHLGFGEPGLEAGRISRHRRLQLRQRRRLIAHGEVKRSLVRQG